MGVMQCDRRGCRNILSRFYSSEHGYLCHDCYYEGIDSGLSIEDFMATRKENTSYSDSFSAAFTDRGDIYK